MQPRSESLYNPSQSLWFRTIPKQSNLFTHTSFSLNPLVTWLPRFPILWITRQVNTAKHSRVLIIPETEKRLVPILVNDYAFVTSRISWISWDKTVTATPREIRDWGQIKLSSESSSQLNSRDKMTNLRLKAYRKKEGDKNFLSKMDPFTEDDISTHLHLTQEFVSLRGAGSGQG